ncbi:MAG: hypothetical protein AB8G11_02960, partial [Saprospiraceae bacterium]
MKALNKYFLVFLSVFAFNIGANAQCTGLTAPFTETFDGTTLPICWTESATSGGPWDITPTFFNFVQCNAATDHTGNNGNFMGVDMSGTDAGVVLTTADINVSALTVPYVRFFYWMCGVGYSPANELYVEAFDGTNWNIAGSITTSTAGWEPFGFDLSSHVYNGNFVRLRFRAESGGSGSDFYGDHGLDDVSVIEAPTCLPVDNVTATDIGNGTIQVSYTPSTTTPPVSYNIEYGPAGFSPGSGTVVSTTNTTYDFVNLGGCQTWAFYVTPICAGNDVGLTASVVTASYVDVLNAPYSEAFAGSSIPVCWTQNQTTAFAQWKTTGAPYAFGTTPVASNTSDGSTFVWLDMSSTATPKYLTMPEVNISGIPTAALSFWLWSDASLNINSAQNTLVVEASNGAGGWNLIATINQNAPDWQFKLYDLANFTYGTNNDLVQIRFNGIRQTATGNPTYNDLVLDDIKIDALPSAACTAVMAPDTTDFEDAGSLNPCWEQIVSPTDDFDWSIGTGSTGTPNTGPSGAHDGMYYAYIESSAPAMAGHEAILMSPPINTANLMNAPALYFNYHMYGNNAANLKVEYEIFGSGLWRTIWESTGGTQSSETDSYLAAYAPIPDAANSIMRVRFIATVGSGNAERSDIAIDGIRVQNVLADDLMVTNITTPGNGCGLGITPLTVEVTNRGFNNQNNIPVFVAVNGGAPIGANIQGPISGNGGTATVDVFVDMTNLGQYDIMANIVLATDEVPTNDMMTAMAYNQPNINTEYSEEFEGMDGYWYGEGDWEHGMPTGTTISGAAAGSEAFVTNLSGDYSDDQMSYLYSPCFDLSGMTSPSLRFSINWDIEDNNDGAWLEYSVGGGAWTKLGVDNSSGQNWYNDDVPNNNIGWAWSGTGSESSGGWLDAIIDLSTSGLTPSADTRFRFVVLSDATNGNEGLGIDNFGVFDGPCVDVVFNETLTDETAANTADGSIVLNPVGGFGNYTYLWSDGSTGSSISGLIAGTYTVTVTHVGTTTCTTTGSFTIMTICPSDLGLSTSNNPTIGDGTSEGSANVVATSGLAPYTYAWDNGTTTDQNFNLAAGDYTVTVTDANGCTDTITVTINTEYLDATDNIASLRGLNISPNPAKDYTQLNIAFEESVDLTVRIADVTGRVLE